MNLPPVPAAEFALYSLGGSGPVASRSGARPFDPVAYSRYKYGSITAADAFARAVGEAFAGHCPAAVGSPRLLMASPPHPHVPTPPPPRPRRLRPFLTAAGARRGLPGPISCTAPSVSATASTR